ncbi:MAG: hypothetical protein WC635_09265 [Bacteriovorax sp.]|jgi:hypothetical protein
MKLIHDTDELKKGDTIIVKDQANFSSLGYAKVVGDVFDIEYGKTVFSIKCKETDSIEKVSIESGKIFLIN